MDRKELTEEERRKQRFKERAEKIHVMMSRYGFDHPELGEDWQSATAKLFDFIEYLERVQR
jgi:hypothetical protein